MFDGGNKPEKDSFKTYKNTLIIAALITATLDGLHSSLN